MTRLPDDFDDAANDAAIDRFHDGWGAFLKGQPRPTEKDAGEGWDHGRATSRVRAVQPARPEGYYHLPVGSFD